MGWQFPYVSTYNTDFAFDFGPALTEEQAQQISEVKEMIDNPPDWLQESHFGFLGGFVSIDNPTSGARTQELMGWLPEHAELIPDMEEGHYFSSGASACAVA